MLNLSDYENGIFTDPELKGVIGSDLFQIDNSTKFDVQVIAVPYRNRSVFVEVFKAYGNGILQVCASYTIEGARTFGGGQCFYEMEINRKAISEYCIKNNIQLRCEIAAWGMTRCIVVTENK